MTASPENETQPETAPSAATGAASATKNGNEKEAAPANPERGSEKDFPSEDESHNLQPWLSQGFADELVSWK